MKNYLHETYLNEKIKETKYKGINNTKIKRKVNNYKETLKLINHFIQNKTKPHWLIIKYLPVIPPNLRPIIKLKDNNLIISEMNYLYSAIINANNKIKKLQKMLIPKKYTKKERKILQIKIDELIKGGEKKKSFYKEKKMRI